MKRVKRLELQPFPASSLKPGDHLLMCEHLVKQYWCNLVRTARVPECDVYVEQGGRFKREDGTTGDCVMSVKCNRSEVDLWEVVWTGSRLRLADSKAVA